MRVSYLFQRARRRSIGFVVGPDGLEVRAPKWVTLKEVELGCKSAVNGCCANGPKSKSAKKTFDTLNGPMVPAWTTWAVPSICD